MEDICELNPGKKCNDQTHKHTKPVKIDILEKHSNEELHDAIDNSKEPNSPKTSVDNNVLSVSNGSD